MTPITDRATTQRIRSVQYLRACAALMVVGYHASKRVGGAFSESMLGLFEMGHGGVDLFFVISGFIMWSIGRNAARDPVDFAVRRIIRVAPLYWIATIAWVTMMAMLGVDWIVVTPVHTLQSLLFLPHWSPTYPEKFWPVLVPGWTLMFEMYFYALFALALMAPNRARLATLLAMIGAMVIVGVLGRSEFAWFQAYTSPLLLEFLAGVLIGELWHRGLRASRAAILLVVAGLAVLLTLTPLAVADQTSWGRPLTFGLAGMLIVIGFLMLEERLPDLPLLEQLGDASYAIYLFHLFVVQILAWGLSILPVFDTLAGGLTFVTLCMVAASALGLWLFAHIERPLQKELNMAWRQMRRPRALDGN